MSRRNVFVISWVALLLAMVAMVVGHGGAHHLNWREDHISTYAATGPRGIWITGAMVLCCVGLVCVAVLVTGYGVLGNNLGTRTMQLFLGATVGGLAMLAWFHEATGAAAESAHQQELHDLGLSIFFHSAIFSTAILGILIIAQGRGWWEWVWGAMVILLGVGAFGLMALPWPGLIGIQGSAAGLVQRASLVCLWGAFVGVMGVITMNDQRLSPGGVHRTRGNETDRMGD